MPLSLILLPLLGLVILNLPFPRAMKAAAAPLAAFLFLAQAILALLYPLGFWDSVPAQWPIFAVLPLAVDMLSAILLFSIGLVCFCALLVGRSMFEGENERFNFTNVLILGFMGLNGTVMASDLFSLYVFIEVSALASFILIALPKDSDSLEGAFKYIVLSAIASVLMLSAIGLLLMVSGGTSFATVAAALRAASADNFLARVAIGAFLCGLFIKGGLIPFHGWLPDAYSAAPAGVSVFLAGIVTKASGVYTLIRLVTEVIGFSTPIKNILLLIGAVSIVVGALAALTQKDFKRMLAYSSISQVGYIVISLGCGTMLGLAGAILHLLNHAVFKSQLFVNAAAVEQRLGTRDMDKMGGLAAKMPFTGATSVLGLLSTAGIPPLGGFWSKLLIIMALWAAGYHAYAVVAVLASVLTLAYFLLMQRRVFFGKLGEGMDKVREAGAGLVAPAVVLAGVTVAIGLAYPLVLKYYILPASLLLP